MFTTGAERVTVYHTADNYIEYCENFVSIKEISSALLISDTACNWESCVNNMLSGTDIPALTTCTALVSF